MNFGHLRPMQLDALREISNIGMGHAATALCQMIGSRVDLNVPRVTVSPLQEVPELLGGSEAIIAGVYLQVYGDARGNILLTFPQKSVAKLLEMIMPGVNPFENGQLTEFASSAMMEIGNILSSAYMGAMSELIKITLIPGVPAIAYDMAGAVVDYILIELGAVGDLALVIETEFFGNPEITGQFFLLPDPSSLEIILKAVGISQ